MKRLSLVLPILCLLTACGSDHGTLVEPAATPKPDIKASPTPTPSPVAEVNPCAEAVFLGSWTAANDLSFKDDCSALSGSQKLTWGLTPDKFIQFKQEKIEIDSCSYQIDSTGGLSAPLVITLKLNCDKSGLLSYTKK